jgi:hypothetical protein
VSARCRCFPITSETLSLTDLLQSPTWRNQVKRKHWIVILGTLGVALYASRRRDAERAHRREPVLEQEELMRWEDEGGNVVAHEAPGLANPANV